VHNSWQVLAQCTGNPQWWLGRPPYTHCTLANKTGASPYNESLFLNQLYAQVRGGVDDSISWILRNRERDPYKNTLGRVAYEYAWGGTRSAPSFTLPGEAQKKDQQQQQQQQQQETAAKL